MKTVINNSTELTVWPLVPSSAIPGLLDAVNQCGDDVYYLSPEGDVLNLKSELSRYLFAILSTTEDKHLVGSLGLKNPADFHHVEQYVMEVEG